MKRGEIWSAAGSGYLSKPRPAIILQSDFFADVESVIVCPITSVVTSAGANLIRVELPKGEETGLKSDSWAMIDKHTTVRRTALVMRIGYVPKKQLDLIARLSATFLGLAE